MIEPEQTAEPIFGVGVEGSDHAVTLRLSGELDLSTVGVLREHVDAIASTVRRVDIDLAELTFIDSTGIGAIVDAHRLAGPHLRELRLVNAMGHVRSVLDLAGLGELVEICDDSL